MMEAVISIKPFGFDRVFRFASSPEEAATTSPASAELQDRIAALEEQIEQMRCEHELALEQARAQGLAQGLEQARGERAEALLAATDALHASLDDLGGQVAQVRDGIMRDAADVALCAAELIAGHAVERQPGRALDEALGRALKQLSGDTALVVRVHPDSLEDIKVLIATRADREGGRLPVTVVEDDRIAPNDGHISWAEGGLIVDAASRHGAVRAELRGLIQPVADV
jgi:flagellar assembly protein FliH